MLPCSSLPCSFFCLCSIRVSLPGAPPRSLNAASQHPAVNCEARCCYKKTCPFGHSFVGFLQSTTLPDHHTLSRPPCLTLSSFLLIHTVSCQPLQRQSITPRFQPHGYIRPTPSQPHHSLVSLAPARISELAYTAISLLALAAFGSLKSRRIDIASRVEPQTAHTPTCAFLRVLFHRT